MVQLLYHFKAALYHPEYFKEQTIGEGKTYKRNQDLSACGVVKRWQRNMILSHACHLLEAQMS